MPAVHPAEAPARLSLSRASTDPRPRRWWAAAISLGIESALDQAREAAGGKDVMLWGGGQVAQQYLAAGLLDELELHVVPVLLGDGARLFDNDLEGEAGDLGERQHR